MAAGPDVQLVQLAAAHPGAVFGNAWPRQEGFLPRWGAQGGALPLPTLPPMVSEQVGRGALCTVASEPLSKQHFTERESLFYYVCPVRLTFKRMSHLEIFSP